MKPFVKFDPSLAKHYASRAKDAVSGARAGRLGRGRYVKPARRGEAGEEELLLLDAMETGFAKASMLGGGFGRVATYARLRGPAVDAEALAACLVALQARHPYLRRCIAETRRGLVFAPWKGRIPMLQHQASSDLDIDRFWRRIESRPLRVAEALARVHLIRFSDDPARTDLIVEIEHCICDGASLMFFTGELVEQLCAQGETGVPASLGPLSLSPSVNARSAEHLGGTRKALTRLGQHLLLGTSGGLRKIPALVPRNTRFGHTDCHTHIVRASFTPKESQRLRRAAKARGASVSSVLGAACALGIADRLFAQPHKTKKHYLCLSYAVSLRHRYGSPIGNEELGLHATGVDPTLGFSPESGRPAAPSELWAVGRQLRRDIQEAMRPGRDAHWALAFMTGAAMQIPVRAPKLKMPCSMILTDCARYRAPERVGRYALEDLRPFVNGLAFNNPFVVVTPTVEGGLMLSLFAPVPAFSMEDLQAVIDGAASRVRAALRAEPSVSSRRPASRAPERAA